MAINPSVPGVHHIGLRSTNFDVTKKFYTDIIGWPVVVDTPDLIIFATGSVFIAFKKAGPMRESDPIPSRTFSMSTPICSHNTAISFIKEIRVANMALAAYLVISASFTLMK